MARKTLSTLFLIAFLLTSVGAGAKPSSTARAQEFGASVQLNSFLDQAFWCQYEEIESTWKPDYLQLATGDPNLTPDDHGVYAWPFDLDSIGWSMQSYQDYGGSPYFHHGMDMMKIWGTNVYNRSGGQVINIENYQPGWDLYWEVAVLDPYGYIWQYHHVNQSTIPQYILDKFAEYQADPVNGGFIPADTYIGDIIEWPVVSFGKVFNHIHLNILATGGVYVNGFEFHNPLPDTVGPEIQDIGLLQNGQMVSGNSIEGNYSLYVHARDLILDDVYYLPPWEFTFSVDGGPEVTTWRFDTLPGGADDTAYLSDFYVVPPTCGDYECRDYYIDLGFIPGSQFVFPWTGGEHTVTVTVSDYAGSSASQSFTYTVIGSPPGTSIWQDDFESDQGWITNPNGTDTATSGLWERGIPESTISSGFKQLGTTPSGVEDLVTGRLAGANANSNDVDGGITSIQSPEIALPAGNHLILSFEYYLAHGNNASSADYLKVSVVGTATIVSTTVVTTQTVFEERGAANNDDGAWVIENTNISPFAGQTISILIEAADASSDSLVEAGIDNVVIISTGPNQLPSADPQSLTTLENTPLDVALTGSDPDGDPLSFSVVLSPTHGTITGTAPNLTYTPAAGYTGADSFTFVASDGQSNSEPAVINIDVTPVNEAPVANPQSVSVAANTSTPIVLSGSDPDGDPLTFTVVLSPTHGTLSGGGPNLVYTPEPGYAGPDSFTFVVNDGALDSAEVIVSIVVNRVAYMPIIIK